MEKVLTIVIPTYNMEKYLPKCLNSLIISEEKMLLFEVLIINDGSKDSSLNIGHEYEYRYPQTFRVIDKENGNYGSCINRGLKEATGKYIKVLDADDTFSTKGFCELLEKLNNDTIVDLVITDYIINDIVLNKNTINNFSLPKEQVVSLNNTNVLRELFHIQMHAITYRTSLLKDINYVQTEGISYTDQEWCFYPIVKVNNIRYHPIIVYDYLIGREGQTMSFNSLKKMISHTLLGTRKMLLFFAKIENSSLQKAKLNYLERRILQRYRYIYRFYLLKLSRSEFRNDDFLKIEKELKEICPKIYSRLGFEIIKVYLPIPFVLLYRLFNLRLF